MIAISTGSFFVRNVNVTDQTNYVANGLDPFTSYTFVVAAVTSAGPGNGTTVTARTDEDGRFIIIQLQDVILKMNYFIPYSSFSSC